MSNKVKILVIATLVVILVAVLNLYTFLESSSKTDRPTVTNNMSQTVQQKIADLYIDEETGFIQEDITEEYVESLRTEIDDLNESTLDKNVLNRQLDEIVHRVEAKEAVNGFYPEETPAIKANQVAENLSFKEGLTIEQVEEAKEKYYFVLEEAEEATNTVSDQVEEADEEVETLDDFQTAINAHIDYALEGFDAYETAKKALDEVKALPIEDGKIGTIAQAMAKFESAIELVEAGSAKDELTQAAADYVAGFIVVMQELTATIPQYYDLALTAVEPSSLLTAAMLANVELLNPVEESSEESSEQEVIIEEEWSAPESSWTPPESSWTPPSSSTSPPEESSSDETGSEPTPDPEPTPETPSESTPSESTPSESTPSSGETDLVNPQ